jgi:hypothetical protein
MEPITLFIRIAHLATQIHNSKLNPHIKQYVCSPIVNETLSLRTIKHIQLAPNNNLEHKKHSPSFLLHLLFYEIQCTCIHIHAYMCNASTNS